MMVKYKIFWLATRDGIPCGSFDSREKAISWLKKILRQISTDFDKQDKPCEFDYPVDIKGIKIKQYEEREPYLGS